MPEYNGQKEFDEKDTLPVCYKNKNCIECSNTGVWKVSRTNDSPRGQGSKYECTECELIWNTGSIGF